MSGFAVTAPTVTLPAWPTLATAPRLDLPTDARPHLLVVVDAEEEFDWDGPFRRSNTHVTAMRSIGRVQRIFDRFGLRPSYVVDYPVASQPGGISPLREIYDDGRCDIGAHLHPWVSPPYIEELTVANSFTCNLSSALQRAKLERLADQIEAAFGQRPRTFKAGRYGLGASTIGILDELGFEVDNSVCPRMDNTAQGGPSYAAFDARPFRLTDRLMEFPCTVDYVGWAGPLRPFVHKTMSAPALAPLRPHGVLNRLGVVNQVMLSPEGNDAADMCRLAAALQARGQRVFTLSLHSPSVEPGHTPYVRTSADLDRFLQCIEQFCEFFFHTLRGVAATHAALRTELNGRHAG